MTHSGHFLPQLPISERLRVFIESLLNPELFETCPVVDHRLPDWPTSLRKKQWCSGEALWSDCMIVAQSDLWVKSHEPAADATR
jgi:hypothetical protein